MQVAGGYGVQTAGPPSGDSLYFDIVTLLDEVLLPSLSHLDSNCSVAEEMWSLLKLYPYQYRWVTWSLSANIVGNSVGGSIAIHGFLKTKVLYIKGILAFYIVMQPCYV